MATIDLLSSDIIFPSDSNEPKLSANASKLPHPVDWTAHDYYSTLPLHELTDLRRLESVPEKCKLDNSFFTLHQKNDSAVFLVFPATKSPAATPVPADIQQNLRAALRGALELVENDLQRNHQEFRPVCDWSWKDDMVVPPTSLPPPPLPPNRAISASSAARKGVALPYLQNKRKPESAWTALKNKFLKAHAFTASTMLHMRPKFCKQRDSH